MSRQLILRPGLKAKGIAWSNKHILSLEKLGKFPRRTYLGPQTPAWDEAEIDAYIEGKLAERTTGEAA